ncbi:hypothetical protein NSQ77_05145 [Oceanobacillus sp. FSL K6-2867]|uniref:hypothetical protein n=1 Tax=Oceanobacillus sp. FSL K6-2867 TaxID=2954748 RepID=UPI0030D8DF13
MKKKLWIPILIAAIAFGGAYLYVKLNPPLEIGTLASSENKHGVVIGVGNKGLGDLKQLNVSINNNEKPSTANIQVSNALQGFFITNEYNREEFDKYGIRGLEGITIKTGTSPTANFEKQDGGTATKEDTIYGITVFHSEPISEVQIKYSYFGIPFRDTVILN